MSSAERDEALARYLDREMTAPDATVMQALAAGPIDPSQALPLADAQRLLDPSPLPVETGFCTLPHGVGHVAVRTAMPKVSGEMIDWWFDWHPRDPLRYRVWHPKAHLDNSLQEPAQPRQKRHWGAVHHPVEDVGTGIVHARIAFLDPRAMGISESALSHPKPATIVCGYAGDDRLRMRHSPMFHVFLYEGDGVVLRSRFWLGAAIRPYGPLGPIGERLLNNRQVRRRALPKRLPQALAQHCAEEYANLGTLLPELYERFA
ncbi:MAG TPA: hypothetical protein VGF95_00290 [Solirubrobacteraceae bacterium]|jgi:hypothetical protein